jgi:hypothetical protein
MKMKCWKAFSKIIPVLEEPEQVLLVVKVFQEAFAATDSISEDLSNDLTQLLWPYRGGLWGEAINDIVTSILNQLPDKVKKEKKTLEIQKCASPRVEILTKLSYV